MERYKCIKKYPAGPEKGTVVYHPHREKAYDDMYFKMKNEKNVTNYLFFEEHEIKEFPEFWKKMK